jgi:hypothetical protein
MNNPSSEKDFNHYQRSLFGSNIQELIAPINRKDIEADHAKQKDLLVG